MSLLNFNGQNKTPLVHQVETSECALACLAMISGFHGKEIDLIELRRRFPFSLKGATAIDITNTADELGLDARALKVEIDEIEQLILPAILHFDTNHFVVLTKILRTFSGKSYLLNDPSAGHIKCSAAQLSERFTGVAIEFTKSSHFTQHGEVNKLKVYQLWSKAHGFGSSIFQLVVLSCALQITSLIVPLFLQISIDNVLPGEDVELLKILFFGFFGVICIQSVSRWVRAVVVQRVSSTVSFQISSNLFKHLMRLPLPWFERRHVGDIISRFSSGKTITDIISQGIITGFIDSLLMLVTVAMMFAYSQTITACSISCIVAIILVKVSFFSSLRNANVDIISENSKENSYFIESARGFQTIKSNGEEIPRYRQWQKRKANAVNSEIKSGNLNAKFSAIEGFINSFEQILFVYFSINEAILGNISIGMIFALQSYRVNFMQSSIRLIDQVVSYRLLNMHAIRISDIALSPPEEQMDLVCDNSRRKFSLMCSIELRNIRFRYGHNEPEILKGVSFKIEAGEIVGLVGPSGGGKTTLLKIMMGLLKPTSGEILVNNEILRPSEIGQWRSSNASVYQDDSLFAGTISDNICFFSDFPDRTKIVKSCELANISQDIEKMPMRYNTPVGDMGSVLSAGQKQRILLARALYRDPSVLFLDEATSHLDSVSESSVLNAISDLECTRVMITHQMSAMKTADRLIVIEGGVSSSYRKS